MFAKILRATIGAILTVAGVASANGDKPTKFTIRIENITKPDAFTASNGVKWSARQVVERNARHHHVDNARDVTTSRNIPHQ